MATPCDSHGERLASMEAHLGRLITIDNRLEKHDDDIAEIKQRCAGHDAMESESERYRERRKQWESGIQTDIESLKETRTELRVKTLMMIFLGQAIVGAATLLTEPSMSSTSAPRPRPDRRCARRTGTTPSRPRGSGCSGSPAEARPCRRRSAAPARGRTGFPTARPSLSSFAAASQAGDFGAR